MLRRANRMQGDTIVEVLFAVSIFSLIAVGALSIMNQGVAISQRALEITLVRAQMDSQAEALRYLNNLYVADYGKNGQATTTWDKIITANKIDKNEVQSFDDMVKDGKCSLPVRKPFTIDTEKLADPDNAVLTPTSTPGTYAQVRYDTGQPVVAEGVWIQAVQADTSGTSDIGYYDFHIRACWDSPGQDVPITLGTIVRLYVPHA